MITVPSVVCALIASQAILSEAMYIAYGLAGGLVTALTFAAHALGSLALKPAMLVAACLFLPLVPFLVRLSRTMWIYFDRTVDP